MEGSIKGKELARARPNFSQGKLHYSAESFSLREWHVGDIYSRQESISEFVASISTFETMPRLTETFSIPITSTGYR